MTGVLRTEKIGIMAVCTKHSDEQTYLACAGCDRPFCYRCLIQGPVGSKCRDCSRGISPTATTRERMSVSATGVTSNRYAGAYALLGLVVAANLVMFGSSNASTIMLGQPSRFALKISAMHQGEWWRLATGSVAYGSVITLLVSVAVIWWLGRHLAARMSTIAFLLLVAVAIAGGTLAALLVSPTTGIFAGLAIPGGLLGAYVVGRKRNGVSKMPMPFDPRIGFGVFFLGWMVFGALSSETGGAIAALGGALAAAPIAWLMFDPFNRDSKSKKPPAIAAGLAVALIVAAAGVAGAQTGRPTGPDRVGWLTVGYWEEHTDLGDYQSFLVKCSPTPVLDGDAEGFDAANICAFLKKNPSALTVQQPVDTCTNPLIERMTIFGTIGSSQVDALFEGNDTCGTALAKDALNSLGSTGPPLPSPATTLIPPA
jgi:membrane associated rhomboid family serine protease